MMLLIALGGFFRGIARGMRDPEFRGLLAITILLLVIGTIFYARVEGWTGLDAFYFCVTTLTTIGLGDLTPTFPISKIFTIVYIFLGIGILFSLVEKLARGTLSRSPQDKA